MARKKIKAGKPPGVDMLAFSSIMTIMLAFFIMLTSFISDQNEVLLLRATASFKRAVSSFGLNSIIEKIGGKDIMQLDSAKFRQDFALKDVDNIHIKQDKDNNILEEDIEFESMENPKESYIPTLVKFDFGNYKLNDASKNMLNEFIALVADRPSKIIVEGRAGAEESGAKKRYMDWYLASYRAHAVADYLSTKGKIDPRRISVIGYGRYRPIGEQEGDKGVNSLVSLIIIKDK